MANVLHRDLALLSGAAYRNPADLDPLPDKDLQLFLDGRNPRNAVIPYIVPTGGFFSVENAQAFLFQHKTDPVAVLAFRGTEMAANPAGNSETSLMADVINDIQFFQVEEQNNSSVHRGFKKYIDLVWPSILARLESLPEGTTLHVTGHSLGGAAASIAMLRLSLLTASNWTLGELATFGCPRVGNSTFTRHLGELKEPDGSHRTTRYTHRADIVPLVPRRWMGLLSFSYYWHYDLWIYIQDSEKQIMYPQPTDAWTIWNRWTTSWPSDRVRHHAIDHYINALWVEG